MPESEQTQNEESLPGGGFLTKKDRQYLRGELEVEGSTERRRRYEIRNRTQRALVDFSYLSNLSNDDLRRVFGEAAGWDIDQSKSVLDETEPTPEGAKVIAGLVSVIELMANFLPPTLTSFIIETAIEHVELRFLAMEQEKYAPVDVSLQSYWDEDESISLEELKEKVESGEQMPRPRQAEYVLEMTPGVDFDESLEYRGDMGKELSEE